MKEYGRLLSIKFIRPTKERGDRLLTILAANRNRGTEEDTMIIILLVLFRYTNPTAQQLLLLFWKLLL